MTDELLLCPFCGSTNVDYIGSPGKGYRVECKGCLAQSGWGDYGIQVKTRWNARHPRVVAQGGQEWRERFKTQKDERPLPTYGQIPWDQLGRDVMGAIYADRRDYEFDPTYYEGHQMVPQINFNSLARIVDKYRFYGEHTAAATEPPRSGQRNDPDWNKMIADGYCPLCGGDCGSANPPVYECPMQPRVVDTGDALHQVLGEALKNQAKLDEAVDTQTTSNSPGDSAGKAIGEMARGTIGAHIDDHAEDL